MATVTTKSYVKEDLVFDREDVVHYSINDVNRVGALTEALAEALGINWSYTFFTTTTLVPSKESLDQILYYIGQIYEKLGETIPAANIQQVGANTKQGSVVLGTGVGNGVIYSVPLKSKLVVPLFPTTYDYLTTIGANQIEEALYMALSYYEEYTGYVLVSAEAPVYEDLIA